MVQLTEEQSVALNAIKSFLLDDAKDVFILRGSAGTGKTTLIAKLVEVLEEMNLSYALLAPTGRAARILGQKIRQITGLNDYESATIHRVIYTLRQVEINEEAETTNDPGIRMIFPLKNDPPSVTLFVIDESSMVGDKETKNDVVQFGSGRLLKDIVTYVRLNRPGRGHLTRLLFVGDPVQLAPIGEVTSPALSDEYLKQEFHLQVASFDMRTVMRQAQDSAILDRATELRDALLAERFNAFSLRSDQKDIEMVDTARAIDLIVQGLQSKDSIVAVMQSNAAALEYNRTIRERLWGEANLPLQMGDILLVNRNSTIYPLSNGDLVKVSSVDSEAQTVRVFLKGEQRVDLSFRTVTLAFRDGNNSIIRTQCLILENLLNSPDRELTSLEMRALLVDFRQRHPDLITGSAEYLLTLRSDSRFNALQVKYGYALTCHKAQGGEWNTAIVDFAFKGGTRNASFFRWAYTAITRASQKLIAVHPPEFSAVSEMAWEPAPEATGYGNSSHHQDFSDGHDRNQFPFDAGAEALAPTQRLLCSSWQAKGITIQQLQHLQYCERYTLVRGEGKFATIQFFYDKKHRVTSAGVVSNAGSDSQLADDALAIIHKLLDNNGCEHIEPFIQEFLNRLDAALRGSTIQRTHFRAMPYRLRVTFTDTKRKGDIDFIYNKTFAWTVATEVGGSGSSGGLYEEVQVLMKRHQEV